MKKALIKDLDGTFIGHVGDVIPQSEFEWGGDPRRGLGDYRIPKEMVTRLDGSRIAYDVMMPNKGRTHKIQKYIFYRFPQKLHTLSVHFSQQIYSSLFLVILLSFIEIFVLAKHE